MIKWKFVLIRLSLLGTLLAMLHFGSAPLISLVVRTAVQMVTGSKLEIEDLNASPFQTRITSGHVRLGHPHKELENLLDLDQAELKFDQAALLRKKFIVTTGSVEGLEFGTGRLDSGILPDPPEDSTQPASNFVADAGKQAARQLTALLNQRFEENFESVHCAREILDRWPAEYDQLLARGKDLERKIREIRDLAEELQDNPLNTLRDLPRVDKSLQDALQIHRAIESLKGRLTQYRTQIVADRDNLLAAKRRDLARIDELRSEQRLNGRSLSQLLIGDAQGRRVDQAISWIKWLRRTFPNPKDSLEAERCRGQTIRFAGQVDQPDFLVRSLKINGHGTMDDKPYTFTGSLAGVTTQPEIHGAPAYLQLDATGNIRFSLKGMIDRSKTIDHDRIIIEIPDLKVASQDLKLDDRNRLCLGRASVEITARIDLIGDQLSGQIKATQRDFALRLDSDMDHRFAREFTDLLNQDLQSVREFDVVARLSGSVARPDWELHTDLGRQLGDAVEQALVRGYEKKKAELIAKLEAETARSLDKIARLVQQQEAKIIAALQEQSEDLIRLRTRVASLLQPGGLRIR